VPSWRQAAGKLRGDRKLRILGASGPGRVPGRARGAWAWEHRPRAGTLVISASNCRWVTCALSQCHSDTSSNLCSGPLRRIRASSARPVGTHSTASLIYLPRDRWGRSGMRPYQLANALREAMSSPLGQTPGPLDPQSTVLAGPPGRRLPAVQRFPDRRPAGRLHRRRLQASLPPAHGTLRLAHRAAILGSHSMHAAEYGSQNAARRGPSTVPAPTGFAIGARPPRRKPPGTALARAVQRARLPRLERDPPANLRSGRCRRASRS
jgi:hypothetical protein